MLLKHIFLLALLVSSLAVAGAQSVSACSPPDLWAVASAFDLAASGLLPDTYPQLSSGSGVQTIPPSVLKAVGWVESNWKQYDIEGRPLVSHDFGYGIMQITTGMAGAFGNVSGQLEPNVQSEIAGDFRFNIAFGARMLVEKWKNAPQVGNGDPSIVENWYYALWAYNGWGWRNNPNNPRFTRSGTPASHPSAFPYQERVLYFVAHPPKDVDGNVLWRPVPVNLPPRGAITGKQSPLPLPRPHHQRAPKINAVYEPAALAPSLPSGTQTLRVILHNTGSQAWQSGVGTGMSLTYHVLTSVVNPTRPFSPFSPGVVAFGQGTTPIGGTILPGQTRVVRVTVIAPLKPGRYRIAWDLEQETSNWLSQSGVLPHVQHLNVVGLDSPAPPTLTPTPTPLPRPTRGMKYIADTSFPDGTIVGARQHFVKGWLVMNTGSSAWDPGWRLHLVSGTAFGARSIAVPVAAPCRSVVIIASMRAPKAPGRYRGIWRLVDVDGHRFGAPLSILVRVRSSGPSGPPNPTPLPTARTSPTATPTPVG